ncbi:MAG: AAA family ATPase [Geminicoccaceae bacterium]
MHFTWLRVSGFKSFSDPVELLIERGLTGIVGPNGCGKSNIVEALRWAMGESSARGLRGGEMEDVIFNGSSQRPAHDVAEVRLKLLASTAAPTALVTTEELEIARRIGRGAGSVYRINGREVRARDVQLLFADAGAGSRSPAIIGQGQIGFIVDAKPGERRRLLEDAAGIGGLQTRRREAELRLEATETNLQRVQDLLGNQERQLAELKKQVRDAERYRKVAAELRSAEALLLLGRWHAAQLAVVTATETRTSHAAAAEAATHRVAELREQVARSRAQLPALRDSATDAVAETVRVAERAQHLRATVERDAAHAAALARQLAEAQSDLAAAEQGIAELEDNLDRLQAQITEDGLTIAELEAALPEATAAAEAARAKVEAEEASARAAGADASARRQVLDQLRATADRVAAQLASAEAARNALDAEPLAETGAAAARVAGLVQRIDALNGDLAALETEGRALDQAALEAGEADRTASAACAGARATVVELTAALRQGHALARERAERIAARQRAFRRLDERAESLATRRAALDVEFARQDLSAAAAALAAAEEALSAADGVLDARRAELGTQEAARSTALQTVRDARRSLDAVEAELRILEPLAADTPQGSLLEAFSVPPEQAAAVAAAIGDDLLAGVDPEASAHWRELGEPTPGQPLPPAAVPLASLVDTPPVLRRRLHLTGVVDPDTAASLQPTLAPGQQLVSPDGGVWRWDGFVRTPGAVDTLGTRLRHKTRLVAARAEAEELARLVAEGEAALAGVETTLQGLRSHLTQCEAAWKAADSRQLRARQDVERIQSALERLAADRTHLEEEAAAIERERAEVTAEADGTADQNDVDLSALELEVGAAEAELARLEGMSATARQHVHDVESRRTALRQRLDRDRQELAAAQGALRTAQADASEEAHRQAERRAARSARLDSLAAEVARLQAEETRATAEQERAAEDATRAEHAFTRAESALAEAREVARAADARLADLRDRLAAQLRDRAARTGSVRQSGEQLERLRERRDELTERRVRLRAEVEQQAHHQGGADELAGLDERLANLVAERDRAQAALGAAETEAAGYEAALATAEGELAAAREHLAVAEAEEARAGATADAAAALVRERLQQPPETILADAELRAAVEAAVPDEVEARVLRLRTSRERIGPVNLRAEIEAGEIEAAVAATRAEEAEIRAAIDRLKRGIGELNREGRDRLVASFTAVDDHFRRLFQQLFGGGKAHLRLVGEDPLTAGLELEASPPGKKLSSISLLSGGEKTMTAIALLFAFFLNQPSPLCVLDEVDAPLDDANVDRFVGLMQEIAEATGTRFLVVTHHPLTMARMDRLYGVTMTERGVSRLVSVALEQAIELRATA